MEDKLTPEEVYEFTKLGILENIKNNDLIEFSKNNIFE